MRAEEGLGGGEAEEASEGCWEGEGKGGGGEGGRRGPADVAVDAIDCHSVGDKSAQAYGGWHLDLVIQVFQLIVFPW